MSAEPLGLVSGTVTIVPYDARWAGLFEEAAGALEEVLGPAVLGIHHVGSTSVPGLCAKPILDILVSIPSFEHGIELVPALSGLNYEFRPDEETLDRHYFRRRLGGIRTHHLSLAEPASHHHRATLAFRDALRANPKLANEYGVLKLHLARRFPRDRQAYIEGKTAFIARVLSASEPAAGLPR
jgi:GrpB-like predicted nucleotidyltransferase (UPF0157 family)